MSERGSFVTEYIYCPRCLQIMLDTLGKHGKFLCGYQLPSWIGGEQLPIIAGKIGHFYSSGELEDMQQIVDSIKPLLCHTVRIAVLAETGQQIFTVIPRYPRH